MIYKKCIMTIAKNGATLDEDIYLYRLDKNIELHFTIVNNKYKFDKSDLNNIIAQTQAAYFQVRLYKNADIKYTFAIQPTQDGVAILTITDDLIDDPIEVGEYDFQISLLDADKTSMISMPIVTKQLHVCEPLVSEDAVMGKAVLGLSKSAKGEIKNAFDSQGNYIREIHNDGEIISAQMFNKFEEALETNTKAIKNGTGGTGTSYDDTAIKADIQTLKDSQINLVEDETSMEGIKDNEYPTLTTTDKTLIGSINEVNAQYKDIANLSLIKHTDGKVYIKKQDGTLLGTGIEIGGSDVDLSKITMSMSGQTLKLMNDGTQIATVEIPTAVVTDEQLTNIIQSKIDDGSLGALTIESVNDKIIGVTQQNKGINLYNKANVINGHYNTSTGQVFGGDANWKRVLKVRVLPGLTYTPSSDCEIICYDEEQNFINGLRTSTSYTIPEGIKYIDIAANTSQYETFMLVLGKNLPSEYIEYDGNPKYTFDSEYWDFDNIETLITTEKLNKQIYGESPKMIRNMIATQIPTAVLGSNTRHFTIFTFNLTDIKDKIQDGEPLYYDFSINETNTSVLNSDTVLWMNYPAKAEAAFTATKTINCGTFNSGVLNKYKGSGDIGFSKSVNNYLNVCVKNNIPDTLATHVITTEWYKPKFTLGSINLMEYLVCVTLSGGSNPSIITDYYTDETYTRHTDMYKYVDNVKSEIETNVSSQIDNVYKVINNGGSTGGGTTSSQASKWVGKKVNFFGDSITAQAKEKELGFINRLSKSKLFGTVRVYGTPSSKIAQNNTDDTLSFCVRYATMDNDVDLVIIHGGINDWTAGTYALGEKTSTDNTTLYGALNNFLSGIQDKFPRARKLFVTPIRPATWKTDIHKTLNIDFLEFSNVISERCKYWGIPILDFTNEGYDSSVSATKSAYTDGGIHPNDEGHGYLADLIGAKIELI